MAIFRLYSGNDGQSHIEAQDLNSHPDRESPQLARHIVFQEFAEKVFIDWHPAPRRQYVIILSGELEIGPGDDSLQRFGPGDARLVGRGKAISKRCG